VHDSSLVVELFGAVDQDEIAHMVSSWCLRVLGSPVRRHLFSVAGVPLTARLVESVEPNAPAAPRRGSEC
jgi:hypothetical protein